MFIFDISNPLTLLLVLIATVLLIFLSQEVKKSYIAGITLFAFLILIVVHVVQVSIIGSEFPEVSSTLYRCIALDFIFIFMTFFSYLWVDDIEAKANNKKSIDDSLSWFWKDI